MFYNQKLLATLTNSNLPNYSAQNCKFDFLHSINMTYQLQ